MAQFFTDFKEYPVDQDAADWTPLFSGADLNIREREDSISGQAARVNATSGRHGAVWDAVTTTDDQEVVLVTTIIDYRSTTRVSPMVRASGSANNETAYMATLHGDGNLHVDKFVSGTFTNITSAAPPFTIAADTWYVIRLRANGDQIQAKCWEPADHNDLGADEPTGWLIDTTDTDIATGQLGARWVREQFYLAFGAATNGDSAPIEALSDEFEGTYELRISSAGQNDWTIVATGLEEPKVFVDGLNAYEPYDAQVRACNAGGCSDWSATVTVEPKDIRYEIRQSPAGQNDWTIVATDLISLEHSVTGLTADTGYDAQVRACYGGACSDWSNLDTTTTESQDLIDTDVDFSVLWNVHQFTHDDFPVLWNVHQLVHDDIQILWNVQSSIDFDLSTSWNIHELVDKDIQTLWNVLLLADRDYVLLWNVAELNIVDVDYEILWNIASDFVQSDFDLDVLWNVNALVDLDIGVFWHVQEQVDFDLGISWNVYELVDSDLDLLWEVESTSAFDLTILWNVEESQPGIDLEILWNVNSITDKDLNILWDVDQAKPSANHDLLLRWHIQSIVPIQPVAPPTWREIREGDTFFLHSPSNGVTGLSGKVRVVKRVYTGDDPLPELEMEYIEPIQRTTPRIAAQNTPASRPESADQDLVRQSKQSAKKVWQLEQG